MIRKQYSQSQMERILAVMPDEITVWKVVLEHQRPTKHYPGNCYCGMLHIDYGYKDGLNVTNTDGGGGFHCLVSKDSACTLLEILNEEWSPDNFKHFVVSVKIQKKDIVKMGQENYSFSQGFGDKLAIAVSRMIMPIYPATEVVEQAPEVGAEAIELMELAAV